jgi:hypothetical protein
MLERHTNTPSIFSAEIPRVACIGLEVRYNAAAQGPKGRGVEVEGTFEEFVGRDLWVERGLPQKVECHFRL